MSEKKKVAKKKKASTEGHDAHLKGPLNNYCFGCGPDNPDGLRLKFAFNEERGSFACHFKLSSRYAGPPGFAHGGIIATILDEAMSKVNRIRRVTALTREMTIEYLKPVPLGKPLVAEGQALGVNGRVHINVGEIRDPSGAVLARGQGKFIAVDPAKIFAKHIKSKTLRAVGADEAGKPVEDGTPSRS